METPALLLLTASLLLEILAVPLPGHGLFSLGFAPTLALALWPGGSVPGAALAGALALLARTALRGAPTLTWRLRELAADLLPLLLGLGALELGKGAGWGRPWPPLEVSGVSLGLAGGVWLAGHWLIPGWLAAPLRPGEAMQSGLVRERLLPLQAGVFSLGALIAALASASSPWLLALIPIGLALQVGGGVAAFWAQVEERRRLERRLQAASGQLSAVEGERRQAQEALARSLDELAMVRGLARTLAGCGSLERSAEALLALARRLVPSETVALFLEGPEGLSARAWVGPRGDRLAAAALLALREPVVERARREGQACLAWPEELAGERLLSGEASALALPIADQGILYLGALRPGAFSPDDLRLLGLVVEPAALALQLGVRAQRQEEELSRLAGASQRWERWARQVEQLLEGLGGVVGALEPAEILERLGELLERLVPHQGRLLETWEGPGGRAALRRSSGLAVEGPALELVLERVLDSGLPLLLEEVGQGPFQALAGQVASLLAIPIPADQGPVGALVLGSGEPGAFQREHQDLLLILAFQVGAALRSAYLHQQVLQARDELARSQAQLVQSSKMAAVGQLAAGVAHELNTPLGAVLLGIDSGLSQLQERPERAAARLEAARRGILQAREIIDKLLAYSRASEGRLEPLELDGVVSDTLALLGRVVAGPGVELCVEPGAPARVLANRSELQQVLTNLLMNARDAILGGPGAGRIWIRSGPEGGWGVLHVEDEGWGLGPEAAARLFEPFYTTKPVGQGTGLGLPVSREIVLRHQGRLEVGAGRAGGARFSVWLPLLEPPTSGGELSGPEGARGS